MRLLLTAITCPKGELETNLTRHLDLLRQGSEAACQLVLMPEMSLTGYLAAGPISLDHPAVGALVGATAHAPALCFGLVEASAIGPPYITQLVAAEGRLVAVHRKAHLGDGEEVDFQAGAPADVFTIAGTSCAIAVCAEIGTEPPYRTGAALILGPSAPGLYGERCRTDEDWRRGFDWWHGSVHDDAARLLGDEQVLVVSTQAGATTDEDFPGWAGVVVASGRRVAELPDWREGVLPVQIGTRASA